MAHSLTSPYKIFYLKLVHTVIYNFFSGIPIHSRAYLDGKFLCGKWRTTKYYWEINMCPYHHYAQHQTTTWHP